MARGRPISQGLAEPRPLARAYRAARGLGLVVVAAAALLAAMAPAAAQSARALEAPPAEAGEERQAILRAEPLDPAPGDVVLLTAEGFPPETSVEVGAGPPTSQYEVIDHAVSDADGTVLHEVLLPQRAEPGQVIVFVMATEDFTHKAVSNPVVITDTTPPAVAAAD